MEGYEFKAYERFKEQAQFYRSRAYDLEAELRVVGPELYRADQKIDRLEQRVEKLVRENKLLKQQVADLTAQVKQKSKPAVPALVKPNVAVKVRRRRPGRREGHVAALRPLPRQIDIHQQVGLPIDAAGKASCPHCRTQLDDVKHHERVVEDIVPSKVVTTCYHTASGYCPCCRRQVESRAADQPPAADLPHAQLGLNTLATAAVMRVCYRLPLRQISRFFAGLPGLKISPGGIVKQLKRLGRWLSRQYHRLKLALRLAGVVYADETGWRTNGRNGYLWALTDADHTLFHVAPSRGKKVIVELLGKAFGAAGQTLVSDFYSVYDQFNASQQKCLVHLLRELRDTIARRPELAGHAFFKRCKRLVQDMLRLKKRRRRFKRAGYDARVKRLEERLGQLAASTWNDADADRLAGRLKKHEKSLTTFLHKPKVDGTNNAVERALRPAVVMRKITGGSRGAESARAWAILASVMRTAEQQGRDVVETIKALLRAEWEGKEIAPLTDSS
jgi:hypothetical protein